MNRFQSEEIKNFVSTRIERPWLSKSRSGSYPKISIITPSFNQAEFLERTILSVLNQNYPDLEYIIIDGGSNDGSVEIIRKYEAWLSYWVSEKDAGQSDALNKGFARATGDIVGWQNADDIYLPGAFYEAAQVFVEPPDVDVVFANRLDMDKEDNVISESRFTPFSIISYCYEGMPLSNQSAFWRRELFSSIGMIDVDLDVAMDYEFFLRAGLRGARFRHVRRYWGAIRRHEASKQNRLWAARMKLECDLIDRAYGRRTYLTLPLRTYSLMRRFLYYLVQGDWDYAVRGLKRRVQARNARKA